MEDGRPWTCLCHGQGYLISISAQNHMVYTVYYTSKNEDHLYRNENGNCTIRFHGIFFSFNGTLQNTALLLWLKSPSPWPYNPPLDGFSHCGGHSWDTGSQINPTTLLQGTGYHKAAFLCRPTISPGITNRFYSTLVAITQPYRPVSFNQSRGKFEIEVNAQMKSKVLWSCLHGDDVIRLQH